MNIKKGKTVPRNTKPYKLNSEDQADLQRFMDYLVLHDIAEPSDSSKLYGCPIFVIKKKNGKPRIIFDVRAYNEVLEDDPCATLPDIQTALMHNLKDAKYVTQIDIKQCFYSLKVSKETMDSGLQNVLTQFGTFILKRAITGSSRTPAHLSLIHI